MTESFYLIHVEMTDEIVTLGEVVTADNDTATGFAPDITETIVGEVGDSGTSGDINTAVCSDPSISAETRACIRNVSKVSTSTRTICILESFPVSELN